MNGPDLILVVEDEPIISDAIASRLRSEGFDVAVADDGPSTYPVSTASRSAGGSTTTGGSRW